MEAMSDTEREIVSTRVLPYPRARVFRAIAERDRIARWWGPAGFTNSIETFDFRPGGRWNFVMHSPEGEDYPNDSVFQDIEPQQRIVMRHESAPGFTMHMTLSDEHGGTRIHWRMVFDEPSVRKQLAPMCIPANEQNFDRLNIELAAHP